jgi:hypothetical protein
MTWAQWLAALKAEGITDIVEMPGWKTHNRNHKGAWGEVHGLTIHHTAGVGTGMADFCFNGTAALPGPLCHDFLAKDGTLYLVGNGRTNHAGTIAANAHTAIGNETMPLNGTFKPDRAEPFDGNRELYGIEIENRGDGTDPYPEKQYDVAVRWAAARCRFHGWSAGSIAGHKEVTTRKVDPSFGMASFRTHVAARLAANDDSQEDTGMDATQTAKAVLTTDGIVPAPSTAPDADTNAYWTAASHLSTTTATVTTALQETRQLRGELAEQRTLITAVLAKLTAMSAKLDAL